MCLVDEFNNQPTFDNTMTEPCMVRIYPWPDDWGTHEEDEDLYDGRIRCNVCFLLSKFKHVFHMRLGDPEMDEHIKGKDICERCLRDLVQIGQEILAKHDEKMDKEGLTDYCEVHKR